MSANERETQENTLHARLVAYVLDELAPSERADVEAALAGSAELRAERERLQATIELVQRSLAPMEESAGAETLSSELAAELQEREARASQPRVRAWYARSSFKAAASIAAVALGFGLWRVAEQSAERDAGRSASRLEDNRMASGTEIAKLEKAQEDVYYYTGPTSQRGASLGRASESNQLDSSTQSPADFGSPAPQAKDEMLALKGLGYAEEPAMADEIQSKAIEEQALSRLRAIGYAGGDDSLRAQGQELQATPPLGAPDSSSNGAATTGVASGGPSAFASRRAGGLKARQKRLEGLGYVPAEGERDPAVVESLQELGYIDGVEDGTYKGPGDSVPPGGGGGEKKDSAAPEAPGSYEQYRFNHDGADQDEGGSSRDAYKRRAELERIFDDCLRRRDEHPRDMFLRFWGDNPFILVHQDPLATLSVDVDTASYALARNYLREGELPPRAAVRTEEFLNYFKPDVPAPTEETFAIHTDLAPSLFGPSSDHWMLRVVVRGREMALTERAPLALTFVMDTSGSMKEDNRLELVKLGLRLLLSELDARDHIALVAFSSEARLILPMTSAADRGVIEAALYGLRADGSTNAEAGLRLGYELAAAHLAGGGEEGQAQHRVVLLSDGVANVGQTDQDRIGQDVARQRERGIYLNTIGVGMGNHNDVFLEQLANKGDGLCNYIDTPLEARRALVDNFTGAFQTIARDVKLQVEFDPAQVRSWRQLGYENRFVADVDFRNDAVDAGEVGAGHQVVALFEIERRSGSPGSEDQPIATVRLRWKEPRSGREGDSKSGAGEASEVDRRVFGREALGDFRATPAGFRRAMLVAQFAEVLRWSVHAREDSLALLLDRSFELEREAKDPDFTELVELMRATRDHLRSHCERDDWSRTVDSYRFNAWRRAECEDEGRAGEELERLQRERDELELRLRELCEQR